MKVRLGYEEFWDVVIDGHGLGESAMVTVNLASEMVARIRRAQKEWEACKEVMGDAYDAAVARRKLRRSEFPKRSPNGRTAFPD